MLFVSVSVMPSINSTSYALVSINGLLCFVKVGLPSPSIFLRLTTACISPLSDPRDNPGFMLTYESLGTTSQSWMPVIVVGASIISPTLMFVLSYGPPGMLE